MASMKDIGKRIYNLKNTREKRRYYVFLLRAMLHRGELRELVNFFIINLRFQSVYSL